MLSLLPLDQLDATARSILPRLGAFRGGAMEPELLAVAEISRDAWPELRRQWEAAGLVAAESVPGWDIPFFRFHPGLAPLWSELSPEEQARLSAVYRRRYYGLANFLYNQDIEHPGQARAMAWLELPNLLQAVHAAFAAGEPAAPDFGDSVLKLLMNRAAERFQDAELAEARWAYEESLPLCRALGNPASEAGAWHELGLVFQKLQDWPEAERCYREALRLREANGLIRGLNGAVATWNQLGFLRERAGDPATAESWYRKAIDACRRFDTPLELAMVLSNLAGLLVEQPDRLDEARAAAEEALSLKLDLDPAVARIWSTYTILALIAERQERFKDARQDRLLALDAKRSFPGLRAELRRRGGLLTSVAAACSGREEALPTVAAYQGVLRTAGGVWSRTADAIDRLLAGERDADALRSDLEPDGAMILETILRALADPSTLTALLEDSEAA